MFAASKRDSQNFSCSSLLESSESNLFHKIRFQVAKNDRSIIIIEVSL